MKTQRVIVPPGRLDVLAQAMLEAGLKANGHDPAIRIARIAAHMGKSHIAQALEETIGPKTKLGCIAADMVQAANEFQRKFIEAQQQIDAEDIGE